MGEEQLEQLAETYAPYASLEDALGAAELALDARVPVREWARAVRGALERGVPVEEALRTHADANHDTKVSRLPKVAPSFSKPPALPPPGRGQEIDGATFAGRASVAKTRKERTMGEKLERGGRCAQVLAWLREHGPARPSAIAEALGDTTAANVSMALKRLSEKGCVVNADDGWTFVGELAGAVASTPASKPKPKAVKSSTPRRAHPAPRAPRAAAKPSGDRLIVDLQERRAKHARAIAAIDNFLTSLGELEAAS